MKGTRIIVTSKPRGVFEDVIVAGTPKPGTVMCIEPTTEPVGGCFTYEAFGVTAASGDQYVAADGDMKAIAILLEKDQEGGIYSEAYADDDRGRIYWPAMGEQFNMILEDVSGTGDDHVIGEELMVDDGTGKLLVSSSAEAAPFTCLETCSVNLLADFVAHVRFNGAGGA